MVCLLDKITNDPKSTKYSIKLWLRNTTLATKDFLKSRNVPDIVSIPIPLEDYINEPKNLTQEINNNIMFP